MSIFEYFIRFFAFFHARYFVYDLGTKCIIVERYSVIIFHKILYTHSIYYQLIKLNNLLAFISSYYFLLTIITP